MVEETPTRRRLLVGAASAAGAVACPGLIRRAAASEKLVFMTPFGITIDFLEMENAVSGGFWAKQGLDASVVGAPGTSVAISQVISGQAQFGMCSGMDYMRAVATKGAPLIAVATINQRPVFQVVSLKDKPVRNGEDFAGKTVGILSFGGTTETYVDLIVGRSGIKRSDVKVVVAGNSPGEVELIRQGRIDCFVCTFAVLFELQRQNAPIEFWGVDRYAPSPGQVYWTRRDLVSQQPDYVLRVLRGLKGSVDEIIAGPIEPIVVRVAKDFELPGSKDPQNLANLEAAVAKNYWLAKGKENLFRNLPELYQAAATALRDVGIADIRDPDNYYTNQFVDKL
jgi:ABC-type nitrate/sulfonate/bicarbonate transport system substrate-binding protein